MNQLRDPEIYQHWSIRKHILGVWRCIFASYQRENLIYRRRHTLRPLPGVRMLFLLFADLTFDGSLDILREVGLAYQYGFPAEANGCEKWTRPNFVHKVVKRG